MATGANHNIDVARQALRRIERDVPKMLRKTARYANARIGAAAVKNHMHGLNSPGKEAGRSSRTRPLPVNQTDKLRRLTARLSRSLSGGFTDIGPGLPKLREGFIKVSLERGPRLRLQKGSYVVYAYIHEHGGTITVPVTAKSRGFFWAMFYETEDPKWKALALTKKTAFRITVRKRPFLGPALDDEVPNIQAFAEKEFFDLVIRVLDDLL